MCVAAEEGENHAPAPQTLLVSGPHGATEARFLREPETVLACAC